ncbi:MAG: hypothetical protein ACKOAZ_02725 [Ilumatobacteraceae bacterium]
MGRLRKADVEALLDRYDDDPVGALIVALRRVLDRPAGRWEELLDASGLPASRVAALRAGDQRSLDELAAELNEQRSLPPGSR